MKWYNERKRKSDDKAMRKLVASMGLTHSFYGPNEGKYLKDYVWCDRYLSSKGVTREQRILLSMYTEEGFLKLFPEYWFTNHMKVTVEQSVKTFEYWVNTGEWK